jgi:predicted DCC family thiol-disulfide oxidoreductase YuxK
MNDIPLPVVLYDPECPLCLRFKQGLQYLDKNLTFVSAREESVYLAFPELSRQECLEKIHMITSERKILKGPAVVDYLITTLPGGSKLAWLLENEQGKKVKDFFYQKVEELRELSHKKDTDCNQCPRK